MLNFLKFNFLESSSAKVDFPQPALPSIVIDPHAWSSHLFTIKKVTEDALMFSFTGPKVDHGKFIDIVIRKGEPKKYDHTIDTTIIWDHGDEYDATQTAKIEVLYF